jgi:hypothetical protein
MFIHTYTMILQSYIHHLIHKTTLKPYQTTTQQTFDNLPNHHTLDHHRQQHDNNFSLTIARTKLDFLPFLGDEPVNWLKQCEKYFALANVPTDTLVPLATLHCYGVAQTWWRSLRTPANFIHWAQFYNMVFNRFFTHSTHSCLENFITSSNKHLSVIISRSLKN